MPADTQLDTGLLPGAEKVRAVAAQYAADADTTGRLAPEVVDALRDAGFARHFVAARWGGGEGTFSELVQAVLTVGEACASTAWCASLAAASSRFAAHLPEEGHRVLWEGGPDAFVVTGLVPSGRAVPVDGGDSGRQEPGRQESGRQEPGRQESGRQEPGRQESGRQEPGRQESGRQESGRQESGRQESGRQEPGRQESGRVGWRLSGRWGYVSGVEFADWALLCAAAPTGEGEPELRFFALPTSALTVRRTWDSAGMRATGSHTVLVEDAFVPAHLSFPRMEMVTGRNSFSTVPCQNVPFQASGALTFIGPAVGAAYGALKATAAAFADRKRLPADEVELVRAAARIDAARHLVEQNASVIDERAFTPGLLARNQRNASFAAELVAEAVNGLLRVGGTSGLSQSRPLQRFWRDIMGATSHVALRFDVTGAAENYAKALMAAE